jgi:hypothetical protein
MARPLGVERKALLAGANLDDAFTPRMKGQGLDRDAGNWRKLAIGGLERVLGQGRKNVGQQQFLMLLFVMDAELDEIEHRGRQVRQGAFERTVDMGAVGPHLIERRTAKHAALGPCVAFPLGLVIAVEQEGIALVERLVAGDMVAQHESLEEPRRMGKMPFGRRGIGKRLDRGVGVAQRTREIERQVPRREQARIEVAGRRWARVGRHHRATNA